MRGMLFAALLITLHLPGAWAQNFPNDDIDAASERRLELSIDTRRKLIFADGRFDYDSAQVFDQFLKQHSLAEGGSTYTVVFNSAGGRLGPAMAIGRTIRKLRFNTVVGAPADNGANPVAPGGCASACSIAFLGGVQRDVPKGSRYGVHQFTQAEVSAPDQAFAAAQFTISSVLAFVAEMGASPSLIETGAKVSPKQMRFLTAEELIEWKVVFKGQEAPKVAVTPAEQPEPPPTTISSLAQPQTLQKTILAGRRVRMYSAWSVRGDCEPDGQIIVKTPKQPMSGRLDIVREKGSPSFPAGHARAHCNQEVMTITNVYYTPKKGFIGRDETAIEIFFPSGVMRPVFFKMEVR